MNPTLACCLVVNKQILIYHYVATLVANVHSRTLFHGNARVWRRLLDVAGNNARPGRPVHYPAFVVREFHENSVFSPATPIAPSNTIGADLNSHAVLNAVTCWRRGTHHDLGALLGRMRTLHECYHGAAWRSARAGRSTRDYRLRRRWTRRGLWVGGRTATCAKPNKRSCCHQAKASSHIPGCQRLTAHMSILPTLQAAAHPTVWCSLGCAGLFC